MSKPSPLTIAKATRLHIVRRSDGSFDVGGDHGTYRVRTTPAANGIIATCGCIAARTGSLCSHQLAVIFHLQNAPEHSISLQPAHRKESNR